MRPLISQARARLAPLNRLNRFNRLHRLRHAYQPPLLHWALAFITGAALALTHADTWITAVGAALCTLFALSSAARLDAVPRRQRLHLTLLLLSPALLAVGYWRADAGRLPTDSLAHAALAGQTVRLEGAVADDPQWRGRSQRLLLHAERIAIGSERRPIDDRVQLHIVDPLELSYGDRIAVEANLTPVSNTEDEYLQWLANQRIAASGLVDPGGVTRIGRADLGWRQARAADALAALNRSLRDALPPPLSGLAQGMISGRRGAIDSELRADLNDTSLSHLIVISGSNLTLLTTIVMAASAWLLGRRPAALLAIFTVLAYGSLIGPDPPVQRAMWMAVVFAAAHLLGRGASALYAVGATAALMAALQPHILLDLSFQLTLAGTLGIIVLMPALAQDFLSGQRGVSGAIRDTALVTLVATLATMPLIALHFERAALIGLAANLLVTPLFSWMLLGSAGIALLGLISDSAAAILAWPLAWLPLRWLQLVAEHGAQLPGAGTVIHGFGHAHLLLIYAAILTASLRPYRERAARWDRTAADAHPARSALSALPLNPLSRIGLAPLPDLRAYLRPACFTAAAAALAAALWLSACDAPDDRLRLHFIDVGQGDAALIVTPDEHTILIDTGQQPDALLAALRRYMPTGARRIDLAVITHPQADHSQALWPILEHYDLGQVVLSPYTDRTKLGRQLLALLDGRDIPAHEARPGQQIEFPGSPSLLLDLLWPPADGLPDSYVNDPNSTSVALRARFGDAAFLFAADINVEQELDLVRNPCPGAQQPCALRADVLKVAHQGSRFSSAMIFLESVRPSLAILSAGADNPHGHPHDEVIDSLQRVGATPLLTAERGDITVVTDGRAISFTTER